MTSERDRAEPLAVVGAWMQAYDRRDAETLLGLTSPALDYPRWVGTGRGHDAIRDLLHRQSFGVAMRSVTPLRRFVRGDSVVVETHIESHVVETGEPAGEQTAAAAFDVRDGRVARFAPHPQLALALRDAGLDPVDDAVGVSAVAS